MARALTDFLAAVSTQALPTLVGKPTQRKSHAGGTAQKRTPTRMLTSTERAPPHHPAAPQNPSSTSPCLSLFRSDPCTPFPAPHDPKGNHLRKGTQTGILINQQQFLYQRTNNRTIPEPAQGYTIPS